LARPASPPHGLRPTAGATRRGASSGGASGATGGVTEGGRKQKPLYSGLKKGPKLGWRERAEREGRAGGRGGKN